MRQATISGRLGRDIEVSVTSSGTSVANFDLAVDGWDHVAKEKTTDWFPVVVWGQTADFLGQYANKGDAIVVKGTLEVQTWESKKFFDADGKPAIIKKTVIKADMGGVELYSKSQGAGSPRQETLAEAATTGSMKDDFKDIDFGGDDIPF